MIRCNVIERWTDGAGKRTALIDLQPSAFTDQRFEVSVEQLEDR